MISFTQDFSERSEKSIFRVRCRSTSYVIQDLIMDPETCLA